MSKFRAAALSAVAVVALAVSAGAQSPAKPDSAHRGKHDGGSRMGQMEGKHRGQMGARGARTGHGRLMAELNLTDAQKTRIKAIHEKYQPQLKSLREEGRTQFKGIRDARAKGDTSTAARQRMTAVREQFRTRATAIRQQEQNEIRAVLTADQRTKWDAAAKERKDRFDARQKKQAGRATRTKA